MPHGATAPGYVPPSLPHLVNTLDWVVPINGFTYCRGSVCDQVLLVTATIVKSMIYCLMNGISGSMNLRNVGDSQVCHTFEVWHTLLPCTCLLLIAYCLLPIAYCPLLTPSHKSSSYP